MKTDKQTLKQLAAVWMTFDDIRKSGTISETDKKHLVYAACEISEIISRNGYEIDYYGNLVLPQLSLPL